MRGPGRSPEDPPRADRSGLNPTLSARGRAADPAPGVGPSSASVRMHGLENLRVADAAIMPDCVRANTNITSMAIGERIADLMRWRALDANI